MFIKLNNQYLHGILCHTNTGYDYAATASLATVNAYLVVSAFALYK